MRIILASGSPRRKELLGQLFSEFEIITEETDETLADGVHPRDGVAVLAVRKGKAVANSAKINKEGKRVVSDGMKSGDELVKRYHADGTMIISADTLVELDGVALGKPTSKEDAVRMLTSLSGREHNVHTGVAVTLDGKTYSGTATSVVTFKTFDDGTALEYVNTGEPMDKAGAYAIQGIGGALVEGYSGDFNTIVGLSTRLTLELIERALTI